MHATYVGSRRYGVVQCAGRCIVVWDGLIRYEDIRALPPAVAFAVLAVVPGQEVRGE